ncbi:MAG: glycosyltransferase family 4 protein [Anaerolineae bacterium]|nr:glycosyltransferase family 4 protein [Anaerolineae bacterium]
MRIELAVHHFPPRYTGGAELRTLRTASHLQARGHDVTVTCVEDDFDGPADGLVWKEEVYNGLRVRRLWFDRSAAADPFLWEYDNAWVGDYLRQMLSERQPDVFHLIGGYVLTGRALKAAQELGVPTVVTLTDFWFFCPRVQMWRSNDRRCDALPSAAACARCLAEERRRYRIPGRLAPGLMDAVWRARRRPAARIEARRAFLLDALNGADCIISPSQFLHRFAAEAGVDPARMRFIRQGRDFPPRAGGVSARSPNGALRVGYLGAVVPYKGVHVLVEAVQRLPRLLLEVSVYGDDAGFPRYGREIRAHMRRDDRLRYLGVFPKEALGDVLEGLDAVVVPSIWYENSPNVILEAFAHRLPVVTSDIGGMAELVEHEVSGLLFRAGDSADLARQLRRLAEEPSLLETLRAGVPPVKSIAAEMDELVEVYRLHRRW